MSNDIAKREEKSKAKTDLLILFVVSAILLLWNLGTGSLLSWDEGLYAEVSREILKTGNWIDVHQLEPLPVATVALPEAEGHEMDFFVMQHSTHQPWADHGDELPIIEFASGSSR